MPATVAMLLFVGFVAWLLAKDTKRHRSVSHAIWIPLVWAFLISSKPLSNWLGMSARGAAEDTLLDKAFYLLLLGAGLYVLTKKGVTWLTVRRYNRWLVIYFLYLGISVLWSDEPFTSLKRWIKDVGTLVMVLVVLVEDDPSAAVKALFTRYASMVLPLSVLYIKYYPHLSRCYDMWTDKPVYVGMTTDKNTFGMGLFVCALSLVWVLTLPRNRNSRRMDKVTLGSYAMLIVMLVWLLVKAHSATAISCTVFGSAVLLGTRIEAIRRQVRRLGTYVIGVAVLFLFLQGSGLWQMALQEFVQLVGRDPTLHGRAEIWQAVLKENTNPLIGVGFYSFWSPARTRRVSEGWYYNLGEAHNGYIETYLNNGLIGVALLLLTIAAATTGIKRDVLGGVPFGPLRLAFLVTIVLYCMTESAFDRLVPVWFALLLVMAECPRRRRQAMDEFAGPRATSAGQVAASEDALAGTAHGGSRGPG